MKKLAAITACICFIIILCSMAYANYFTNTIDSAKSGNVKRLEKQLKEENSSLILGKALKCAIEYNRPKCAALIMKYLKTPDFALDGMNTPLELASVYGDNEIVKILIKNGANVNYTPPQQGGYMPSPPLSEAISNWKYDTGKILLENGADPNSFILNIALNKDVKNDCIELIKLCIKKGADLNGDFGSSALEFAIYYKNEKLIDYLLDKGAKIGEWSLLLAADNKDIKLIDKLYKKGIDMKCQNSLNALIKALRLNDNKVFEHLLSVGVPIQADKTSEHLLQGSPLSVDREDAISAAVEVNNYHAAELLLERGADINGTGLIARDKPLYIAVKNCNFKMVEFLLERGADVSMEGASEDLLFNTILNIKGNQVDWFDFQHKSDCNKILELLNKYKNK